MLTITQTLHTGETVELSLVFENPCVPPRCELDLTEHDWLHTSADKRGSQWVELVGSHEERAAQVAAVLDDTSAFNIFLLAPGDYPEMVHWAPVYQPSSIFRLVRPATGRTTWHVMACSADL